MNIQFTKEQKCDRSVCLSVYLLLLQITSIYTCDSSKEYLAVSNSKSRRPFLRLTCLPHRNTCQSFYIIYSKSLLTLLLQENIRCM